MGFVVGRVRVEALGHDPAAFTGEAVKAAEQATGVRATAEEPEVVAEHDDRVDRTETLVDIVDRERPSVRDAPALAHLDSAGRDVDREDVVTAFL